MNDDRPPVLRQNRAQLDSTPPGALRENGASDTLTHGGVILSFRAAFSGIGRTVASQRNMKLHVLSAMMVMVVGMALPFQISTRVALLFAVGMVFFAEILNTGLEALVDLFVGKYHRLAMLAKDAAAGGVLVLAICAVLVFADIVFTNWQLVEAHIEDVIRSVTFGLPLVISEFIGLFVMRRGIASVLRICFSFGCLVPLVIHARDPIFSLVAFTLVLLAAWSRSSFPAVTGRGASGDLSHHENEGAG
jgi:diacylglycerol kinase (ATP)